MKKCVFLLCFLVIVLETESAAKRKGFLDFGLELTNTITDSLFSWDSFKKFHKKNYSPIEEITRKAIFLAERAEVIAHNSLFNLGKSTFLRALNKFSDVSLKEFIAGYNGFRSYFAELNMITVDMFATSMGSTKEPPSHIDWREKGVNTSIKDQEFCQSCWAFAAAGAIEAHEKILYKRDVELSEQNLIDCAKSNLDKGCMGGHMIRAFNYTAKAKGICHRLYYPYEGRKRECRMTKTRNAGTYAVTYKRLPKGDEEELKKVIAFSGPVAAAINGNLNSLKTYVGGIFYDEECDPTKLSHAILIVGYGTDEHGKDYWLIKNTMGEDWGEGGYLRLARNKNNHCGVASDAVLPILNEKPNRRYLRTPRSRKNLRRH